MKRTIVAVLLLSVVVMSTGCDKALPGHLTKDSRWEYTDSTGHIVESDPFSHPTKDNKWEYTDSTGHIEQTDQFSGEVAAIQLGPEDYDNGGYVNKQGKLVFGGDHSLCIVGHFSEGLAPVQVANAEGACLGVLTGYVNKNFKFVIKPQFIWADSFNDGEARVAFAHDSTIGYIDKTGRVVDPQQTTESVFANDQNDALGFDGIPWGTPEYNGDDLDKRFHFENGDCDSYKKDLARVVGPPVDWPSANDLGFADAVSASGVGQQYLFYTPKLPQGVSVRMKDERICYGFFDDKFAFAFSYVGQEAYGATKEKYPLLKTVSAESWGDPPSQSLPSHLVRYTANQTAYLFRRGDTNTRIYVFGESLMYIPQVYLLAIRDRWADEYKKAKVAAAEQQRQYEEQRRQEVNKAVQ